MEGEVKRGKSGDSYLPERKTVHGERGQNAHTDNDSMKPLFGHLETEFVPVYILAP